MARPDKVERGGGRRKVRVGAGGRGSAEGDRELSGYDRALQIKQYAMLYIRSSFKKTTTHHRQRNKQQQQTN